MSRQARAPTRRASHGRRGMGGERGQHEGETGSGYGMAAMVKAGSRAIDMANRTSELTNNRSNAPATLSGQCLVLPPLLPQKPSLHCSKHAHPLLSTTVPPSPLPRRPFSRTHPAPAPIVHQHLVRHTAPRPTILCLGPNISQRCGPVRSPPQRPAAPSLLYSRSAESSAPFDDDAPLIAPSHPPISLNFKASISHYITGPIPPYAPSPPYHLHIVPSFSLPLPPFCLFLSSVLLLYRPPFSGFFLYLLCHSNIPCECPLRLTLLIPPPPL